MIKGFDKFRKSFYTVAAANRNGGAEDGNWGAPFRLRPDTVDKRLFIGIINANGYTFETYIYIITTSHNNIGRIIMQALRLCWVFFELL